MTGMRTGDALRELGFVVVVEGEQYRLDLDTGSISATELLHPRSGFVMYFSGVLNDGRTLSEIEYSMPRTVESIDQAKAWLAYGLRIYTKTQPPPSWFAEGKVLQHLLPWVKAKADAPPKVQCLVERAQFRALAKRLASYVDCVPEGTMADVSFENEILRIKVGAETFAMAGFGSPWGVTLRVDARAFAAPMPRIRDESVWVTVGADTLFFGTISLPILERTT